MEPKECCTRSSNMDNEPIILADPAKTSEKMDMFPNKDQGEIASERPIDATPTKGTSNQMFE